MRSPPCQEAEQLMPAFDGRALRASARLPGRPEAGKGEQGPVLAQREPYRRFARLRVRVLAKRCCRDEAAVSSAEPSSPVRAGEVADVGDRRAAVLRWAGMPQRAMTSSRSPSVPVRTIGAIWSGKIREQQQVAVRSFRARNQSRIAAWPLVRRRGCTSAAFCFLPFLSP